MKRPAGWGPPRCVRHFSFGPVPEAISRRSMGCSPGCRRAPRRTMALTPVSPQDRSRSVRHSVRSSMRCCRAARG